MLILPAHVLKAVNGERYSRNTTTRCSREPALRGHEEDVVKGKMIRIRRRKDYWAEKHRRNIGSATSTRSASRRPRPEPRVRDVQEGRSRLLPRERARMVAGDNFDHIKRGLIQKRKIFNDDPRAPGHRDQHAAGALRRHPVRKALRHLFNRELMIEKLMFNEYIADRTHISRASTRTRTTKMRYDPQRR